MTTQRLFIAIDIPKTIKSYLQELQHQLNLANRVRWTKMDNFHLTLQFLGDIDTDKIEALGDRLAQELISMPSFELRLNKVGAFYFRKSQKARVLWVDMTGQTDILQEVHQSVLRASKDFGFKADRRRFNAHLTLGRSQKWLKHNDYAHINQAIERASIQSLCFTVTQIALIQSQLHPKGSIYTHLKTINLVSKERG